MKQRTHSVTDALLAVLFLLVIVIGFVAAVWGLGRWGSSRAAAGAGDTGSASPEQPGATHRENDGPLQSILDGAISQDIENGLESEIPLREPAIRAAAILRYLLFRAGNDSVVVGADGWLYSREEFERRASDSDTLDARLAFISTAADRLRARGVQVLVALVPAKARIVTEPLPRRWATLAANPRYETAIGRLGALGVPCVDLRPALESVKEPFLRRDTHWSPEGAAAAARAIAGQAFRRGLLPARELTTYQTRSSGEAEVTGDLMNFIPVGAAANALGLPPQEIPVLETAATQAPTLGLFDTPTIPVTLVGTSYSADERWNFVGALQEATGLDVLNTSTKAVGPFVPMAEYLSGTALAEVRPDLVVWEIPERYLTLSDIEVPEL